MVPHSTRTVVGRGCGRSSENPSPRWTWAIRPSDQTETCAIRSPDQNISVVRPWVLAGLWSIFKSKDKEDGSSGKNRIDTAKKLLKRYGSAYLITSISLSLVSITAGG